MSRRRCPSLSLRLAAALLALCLFTGVVQAAKLTPDGRHTPVAVGVNGTVYRYFELTQEQPVRVVVEGPSVFEVIARWRFATGERETGPVDVVVELALDGRSTMHHVLHMRSGGGAYADIKDAAPGRSERIRFDVPSGMHELELRLISPAGVVDVNPLSKMPEVMPWRLSWTGGFRMTYDGNIYRYSDDDVEEFVDGERSERYPFDTTDDLRLDPSVTFTLLREHPGVRSTELRAGANWFLAASNGEKSFSKLHVRLAETREALARVAVEYVAIPSYHLKYVWDADAPAGTDDYRSCDFRKHSFRAELGTDGQFPVDATGWWRYDDYGYDQDFVEYDTYSNTFGGRVTARPASGLRVDAQYAYRRSLSRGYDEVGETKRFSDDSDVTYDQDEYELSIRWDAGRVRGVPVTAKVRGKLAQRYYLTTNTGDTYHAGRDDTMWLAGAQITLGLTDSTSLVWGYEHRSRRSESDLVPTIGATKDYDADRFSVQFIVEGGRFLD
ncbi:hypothetical protein K8S17_02935 [bacterium]|nr:hypothetical protein [bacterium]